MSIQHKWLIAGVGVLAFGAVVLGTSCNDSRRATFAAFSCGGVEQYIDLTRSVSADGRDSWRSRVLPTRDVMGASVMTRANVEAIMVLAILRDNDTVPLLEKAVQRESWKERTPFA